MNNPEQQVGLTTENVVVSQELTNTPNLEQTSAEQQPEVNVTAEPIKEATIPPVETAAPENPAPVISSESPVEVKTDSENIPSNPETPTIIVATDIKVEDNVYHSDSPEQKQKAQEKNEKRQKEEEIFNKLKELKDNNQFIEVEVLSRIRGGLRVAYEGIQMFLPVSHFSMKRNPSEEELQETVGKTIKVHIHELQEFDEGRKAVIVSRKQIHLDEFWESLQVGQIVKGKISSVATFGVFIDIGGVEGLVHISRLSKARIDDPTKYYKKGDPLDAVIVELDKSKNRIALSRKELEESPWKGMEAQLPAATKLEGIVRRMTEFGAYIEVKPGVDGLLRTPEISWTKRLRRPSDVLKIGQKIEVEVISISEEKQTISLSYKRTQPNPWNELKEKYPIDSEYEGTVLQVLPQGTVVTISEELDGFVPRSKMKDLIQGRKNALKAGDKIQVKITDLVPEEQSLILTPVLDEQMLAAAAAAAASAPSRERGERGERGERPQRRERSPRPSNEPMSDEPSQGSFTLIDLLSEDAKNSLFATLNE